MYTVTQRIRQFNQKKPLLDPRRFDLIDLSDQEDLDEKENIEPYLMGRVVDYLSRFACGVPVEEVFEAARYGSMILSREDPCALDMYFDLLDQVKCFDNPSIAAACKLAELDTVYRAGAESMHPLDGIEPDEVTAMHIRRLVARAEEFFYRFGPVTKAGFDLYGGYTDTIVNGDGDYLTQDALWDFKVSNYWPTGYDTLQIMVYWRMGLRSVYEEFQDIRHIGIYNPRFNRVWRIATADIESEIVEFVDKKVIGY